jgi:hypothetical protein
VFDVSVDLLGCHAQRCFLSALDLVEAVAVKSLLAHQKQYVLGPYPVLARPNWIAVQMAEGLFLSHCPKLRVKALRSGDGIPCWLLGLAVSAEEGEASIADIFHLKTFAEIEQWTGSWAGKWLLVSARRCWPDASGCLGVHYRRIGDDIWISSSPALLGVHLARAPEAARIPWRVVHEKGIDWIPVPFTTREGVYKLLPLRTIDPRDGSMRPVRRAAMPSIGTADIQALASTVKTIMANWGRADFSERYIALTAGFDTRTVVAAAAGAGIDFRTYTMHLPITANRDLEVSARVAACVGASHEVRRLSAIDPTEAEARAAAVAEHMDGATFHPGSQYLPLLDGGFLDHSGRVIAHGHGFDLGRCVFWFKLSNLGREAPPTDPEDILVSYAFHSSWRPEPADYWRRALQAWIESLSEDVALKLDWRDRFYLDQRMGAWSSNVQRLGDLFESTFFYPGNCLRVLELLLMFEPGRRMEGLPQKSVIDLLAPSLRKIPINPQPISEKLKDTARQLLRLKRLRGARAASFRQTR